MALLCYFLRVGWCSVLQFNALRLLHMLKIPFFLNLEIHNYKCYQKASMPRKLTEIDPESWVQKAGHPESWYTPPPPTKLSVTGSRKQGYGRNPLDSWGLGRYCSPKAGWGGLQVPESWMIQYASFSGAKSWVYLYAWTHIQTGCLSGIRHWTGSTTQLALANSRVQGSNPAQVSDWPAILPGLASGWVPWSLYKH